MTSFGVSQSSWYNLFQVHSVFADVIFLYGLYTSGIAGGYLDTSLSLKNTVILFFIWW